MKHILILAFSALFLSSHIGAQPIQTTASRTKEKIRRCDYPENAQLYEIITKKKLEYASIGDGSEQERARKAALNLEIYKANEKLKCTTE